MNNLKFHLDQESGYVLMDDEEWLTTAEEVYEAMQPCIAELEAELAEARHQAERNKGYLESIWKVIYPKSDWEYLGQISAHTLQILHEHKNAIAHKDRVIEALAEDIVPMELWYCDNEMHPVRFKTKAQAIKWADAKAKEAE